MEFSDLLKERRAIRDYEDRNVPMELVEEIIAESLFAPSGGNSQPWGFIIVNDRATVQRLSTSSKQIILDAIGRDPKHHMGAYKEELSKEEFNVFYDAPCVVFILGEKDRLSRGDPAVLATYFMLSAASKGLGTCWIGLGSRPSDAMKIEIGLTDDMEIVAPLCLGYPRSIPDVPERKPANILSKIG